MSNIDLLPRADIPVLFNDFKCKADAVWAVVDSLIVTDVSQKEAMALARKTRLTLREIRIAVEHKRVELGEGHLKEIQKVNGAAKAIREFIEPLEARLLVQESFAERVEADRIAALSKLRFDEVEAIKPRAVWVPDALAAMPQKEYDDLVVRLRSEKAELEEANRLRIDAESKLAVAYAETRRVEQAVRDEAAKIMLAQQVELKVESDRLREEQKLRDAEAERVRFEQEAKHRAELQAALAIRTLEREAAEKRRQEDLRIEREKTAVLERQIAATALDIARAAAIEEKRLRDLAVAPDVEKLRAFSALLFSIKGPGDLTTPEANAVLGRSAAKFGEAIFIIDTFCGQGSLTKI